jgi:primosomal protein N' (replication factor Y)
MLVKSHNIPNLGLVIVLEADNALFSKDFRAQEHLLQQMHQVAGRAGRDGGESQVIIQTFHVDHPIWHSVQQHNYLQYAQALLAERKKHQLPPYSYQALVALSGPDQRELFVWAQKIQAGVSANNVILYPPIPSMVAKQAKMYRVVFLLQSQQAVALHQVLQSIKYRLDNTRMPGSMQWNMDIDPIDW